MVSYGSKTDISSPSLNTPSSKVRKASDQVSEPETFGMADNILLEESRRIRLCIPKVPVGDVRDASPRARAPISLSTDRRLEGSSGGESIEITTPGVGLKMLYG